MTIRCFKDVQSQCRKNCHFGVFCLLLFGLFLFVCLFFVLFYFASYSNVIMFEDFLTSYENSTILGEIINYFPYQKACANKIVQDDFAFKEAD